MSTEANRDMTLGGQFALIPASVLYDDQIPATAKLLYGEIYRLSHANGYCYATNKDFTVLLQRSENTVSDLIRSLADAGYIRVKMIRRFGATGDIVQRRIFCGQALAPEDPEEAPEERQGGPPKNWGTSPRKLGDRPPENWDPTYKKKNKKNTPIAPKEILEEVQTYARGNQPLLEALMAFLEMRSRKLKNPIDTLRMLHILTGKLDRFSRGNPSVKILMLDNATDHKWSTVYPLKPDELPAIPAGADGEEDEIVGI